MVLATRAMWWADVAAAGWRLVMPGQEHPCQLCIRPPGREPGLPLVLAGPCEDDSWSWDDAQALIHSHSAPTHFWNVVNDLVVKCVLSMAMGQSTNSQLASLSIFTMWYVQPAWAGSSQPGLDRQL